MVPGRHSLFFTMECSVNASCQPGRAWSDSVLFRIGLLECQPDARPGRICRQHPVPRLGRAVEQKLLDANMIVKPLDMTLLQRGKRNWHG